VLADFMKVRKVPMKRRGRFTASGREEEGSSAAPTSAVEADAVVGDDEAADDPEVGPTLAKIRAVLLRDRALHDKAAKAFVSAVRAYGKHEASFVFRAQDLDLAGLARAWGLLRMPRMPEWSGRSEEERKRWIDAEVNVSTFGVSCG
jgi:ATP-dependent RNA helicase DDX55/SPB4